MGINLEILMFLHSKMNAVKMIKKMFGRVGL